ncbi:MAG: Wzz/FepE/Etk N-terminal domain-containing protein [Pseudomonadota bacterium]
MFAPVIGVILKRPFDCFCLIGISRMTRHLNLGSDEVGLLRVYYQGIAYDVLRILWRYRVLIMRFVACGLAIAIVAVIAIPPRYTSEAILQLNFSRDEPNTATRMQRIASMEASAVVEGVVRILRSRSLAGAVVSRLGLADDPEFSGQPSRLMRVIWWVRRMFGLGAVIPTAHDIATDRLSSALQVNIVPRSYVISVTISASQPQRAAQLANAVVFEYLRGQQVQQLADLQRTIERDIADMSALYGSLHPRVLDANERLQELQKRIIGLRRVDRPVTTALDDIGEFLNAEAVMVPSGPSLPIVFVFVLALSLLACGCLIGLIELGAPVAYWVRFVQAPAQDGADASVAAAHSPGKDHPAMRRLA